MSVSEMADNYCSADLRPTHDPGDGRSVNDDTALSFHQMHDGHLVTLDDSTYIDVMNQSFAFVFPKEKKVSV